MKTAFSHIIPGVGLSELKFGMVRDQVTQLLGEPDEKEKYSHTDKEDEDLTENWHYDELELSLGFDQEDDWRLTTISVTSGKFILGELVLGDLSKEELTAELEKQGVEDIELEEWASEESSSHELLSSVDLGINFWFEEDQLSEIQWSPLLTDDDEFKWPNKEV